MKKRYLYMAAGALLVVAIVVVLVQGGGDREKEEGRGAEGAEDLVNGGDLDSGSIDSLLEYRFKPGKVYHYDFKRVVNLSSGGEGLVDLDLGGPLALHAVNAESQFLDLILELDPSGENPANLPAGAGPILVSIKVDRRGRVAGLKWKKETTADQKNMVRDIVATYFKALPPAGQRPEGDDGGFFGSIFGGDSSVLTYLVNGQDTFGAYTDELRVRSGDQLLKLEGAKKEYTRAPLPVRIEKSEYSFDFDPAAGYFKNSTGEERFEVGGEGILILAVGTYTFEFSRVEDSTLSAADLAKFTIPGSLTEVAQAGGSNAVTFDEAAILPWADLNSMLGALRAETSNEDKQRLFHSLSESMKRDPGIADAALKVAGEYTPDDDQFQMVMGSVAYSGAPLAQDLLVNFYRNNELDLNGQLSVMNAITMMDQPLTDDALDLVAAEFKNGQTEDMRDAAGLALGNALRNNPRSQNVYQSILDEWKAARGTDREATVIEMIGNSGDLRFLPLLKEALGTKNENFRMQVLAAMRFMYSEEVQKLLLDELENHESATIRASAVEALSNHPWQSAFIEPMEDCIKTQANDRVRVVCSEFALGERIVRKRFLEVLGSLNKSALSEDFREYVDQQLSDS